MNVENNDCEVGMLKWTIAGSTSSRSAKYIHTKTATTPENKVIQCIIKIVVHGLHFEWCTDANNKLRMCKAVQIVERIV